MSTGQQVPAASLEDFSYTKVRQNIFINTSTFCVVEYGELLQRRLGGIAAFRSRGQAKRAPGE